tara:strand:- start:589 stop:1302 length:714 start_codon:yes stop_codon:yes gene_type:complete
MAEDKKGFILYADQKELFEQLPNDKAGELIKHIFAYVNDEQPETKDLLIKLAFTPIKQQFKRDLEKWETTKKGRSKAGKASAEARRIKKEQKATNSTNVDSVQQSSTNPTVNDNVNVNVNDIYTTYIETPQQINTLTEEVFLKRWCDARTYYDKLPTNITKLTTFEKIDFKELLQDYKLKDFEQAMQGMFQQKTYLKTRLRPSHFLKRDNFETYLTCFTTKEKLFEDKKYKKPLERI